MGKTSKPGPHNMMLCNYVTDCRKKVFWGSMTFHSSVVMAPSFSYVCYSVLWCNLQCAHYFCLPFI